MEAEPPSRPLPWPDPPRDHRNLKHGESGLGMLRAEGRREGKRLPQTRKHLVCHKGRVKGILLHLMCPKGICSLLDTEYSVGASLGPQHLLTGTLWTMNVFWAKEMLNGWPILLKKGIHGERNEHLSLGAGTQFPSPGPPRVPELWGWKPGRQAQGSSCEPYAAEFVGRRRLVKEGKEKRGQETRPHEEGHPRHSASTGGGTTAERVSLLRPGTWCSCREMLRLEKSLKQQRGKSLSCV